MPDKVPCKECNAQVLPSTAEKNDGLCMPCKKGTRGKLNEQRKQKEKEIQLNKKVYNTLINHGLASEELSDSRVFELDISEFLKRIIPERIFELHSIETGIRDLDEHGIEHEHGLEYEQFFYEIAKASAGEINIESIKTISPYPSEDDEVEMMDVKITIKSNKGRHKFKLKSYYECIVFYKILSWSKKVLGNNVMFLDNEDFSIYCLPHQVIQELKSYGVIPVSPRKCVGNWYWFNKVELILNVISFKFEKLKKLFNLSR